MSREFPEPPPRAHLRWWHRAIAFAVGLTLGAAITGYLALASLTGSEEGDSTTIPAGVWVGAGTVGLLVAMVVAAVILHGFGVTRRRP